MFLGNTSAKDGIKDYLRQFKTIRLGKQAYDINGKELCPGQCLPLFINKTEYNSLMEKMVKGIKN